MTAYYFAAKYDRNAEMRDKRAELIAAIPDAVVTSRWIDMHGGSQDEAFTPEYLTANPEACWINGKSDLEDLDRADVVVSFTSDAKGGKGGRHVEFGYAMARGKLLVVIGIRENIFHTSPQVEHYASWEEFLDSERTL